VLAIVSVWLAAACRGQECADFPTWWPALRKRLF